MIDDRPSQHNFPFGSAYQCLFIRMTEDNRGELSALERTRADARAVSAGRALAVIVAWGIAVELRPWGGPILEIIGDALLALGGWWAARPGTRDGGPEFMKRSHWTSVLALPMVFGCYYFALDLWRLIRGG
jgi:hypothetical protein